MKGQPIKKTETTNLCLKAKEVGIEANTMAKEVHMTLQQQYNINILTTVCKPSQKERKKMLHVRNKMRVVQEATSSTINA